MQLFASVLHLDRKAIKALKVKDTYSLHRVVYSLFEDIRDSEEKGASTRSGIQWVDKGGDAYGRQILMLSNRRPKAAIDGAHGEVICKPVPEAFLSHGKYRFEVLINPVRRDNKTRKLMPAKGREAIADWFAARAENSWGFSVSKPQLQVGNIRVLQFEKAEHSVTLQQAKLNGYLIVTDTDAFSQSVAKGIGRARSFGCGLLQIVPVRESPLLSTKI